MVCICICVLAQNMCVVVFVLLHAEVLPVATFVKVLRIFSPA